MRRLRLSAEARAAAAISDPNVVAVFDVGETGGVPFVVTELLEGETLGRRLRRAPVAPAEAIALGIEIARGLAAVHAQGFVHRDLKPDNVFLTRQGGVKLLDFGVAQALSDDTPTHGSTVVGTPGYVAPEQLDGHPIDARADVFALGAVLHRMLGMRPTGASTPRGPLPPPVPVPLARLVDRCLARAPEERFQSADEVRRALQAIAARPRRRWWRAGAALGAAIAAVVALRAPASRTPAAAVGSPAVRPLARPRSDEAYEAFLRGRHLWSLRSTQTVPDAIEQFNRALQLDPLYAPAYTGLADAFATLGDMLHSMPHREAFARAEAAARRALQLDPSEAEAHATLGHVRMHAWRWAEAEREFELAIQLRPGYAPAHHWRAYNLASQGRLDQAVATMRHAEQLDPLSPIIGSDVAQILYFAGRDREAIAQARQTLQMHPSFAEARRILFLALLHAGERAAAARELETYARHPDGGPGGSVGYAYARLGRRAEAGRTLAALQAPRGTFIPPYDLAVIHAGLGERDRALACLQEAVSTNDPESMILPVDPRLSALRGDPRLAAVLRRMDVE